MIWCKVLPISGTMQKQYMLAPEQRFSCRTVIGIRCKDGVVLVRACYQNLLSCWHRKFIVGCVHLIRRILEEYLMQVEPTWCISTHHAFQEVSWLTGHRKAGSIQNVGEGFKSHSFCSRQACRHSELCTLTFSNTLSASHPEIDAENHSWISVSNDWELGK